MTVSDFALDSMRGKDFHTAVVAEAIQTSADYTFSSFISLLALANVLEQPIESYFPVNNTVTQNSSLEIMFNCSILPKNPEFQVNEKIHLFRCSSNSESSNNEAEVRMDHYVPLIPSSKLFCKEQPMSTPKPQNQPIENLSKITAIPKEEGRPSKRKQTAIDIYFNKSTRYEDEAPSIPSAASSQHKSSPDEQKTPEFVVATDLPQSKANPPTLNERDIGYYHSSISSIFDDFKYELLCNTWKPESTYSFPLNSSKRRFQHKWLNSFPWIAYSKVFDGAFCVNCVLFGGESSHNASKLDYLFKSPFKNWAKATTKFTHHAEKSPIHQTATLPALHFRSCIENKTASIDTMLNNKIFEQIHLNREKLAPVVEAVLLLGR